ncbi:Integrator complex subunit 3 [Phytophthora pseudosyringae]|uniref:Integrator complex subunit 3 n=1 Tax=Phytophthora pseudosyringae TaxID=221518 RepID=A0A8T1WHB1_9STRA|nr:Integrator complex subunit 3 [Phytophthora pseudosyringae]
MDPPPPPPPPSSSHAAPPSSSSASSAPPPVSSAPPPPPGPPPAATSTPPHPSNSSSSSSPALPPSASTPTASSNAAPTPHSKLLNHLPLDAPDELDRKWYAHFYHMQKTIQGKDEVATLAILKQQPAEDVTPLPFQPDIALLYAVVTDATLAKQYLRYLTAVAASDNYKNCMGWLQKLIDLKFVKLLVACRSQLLWLVRELVHLNAPGVDKVIVCLMRYLTGGDPSRTTVWLASSIIRILIEHEAWLLSCSSLIPFVFHTFARISLDHTASQHASLLKQEVELCTTLWNRRQADVAQLGREIVRVLSDAKDIPGMNALWKQLRSVRDTAEPEKDVTVYAVAQLMAIPTPPKYLAYRLNPKMEEYLLFMMERVQAGSVTRYQKWFSSQFLSGPGSDALVPDLVRYICAVYHPSNQVLSSKVTPRYHILGWLYLLCHGSKTPSVLARVQLAMFFDYLYFKPSDNIMTVEPAILLMVKSLKSHPMVTLAMIQFLVFAVEKFAASAVNRKLMQNGVSTAIAMILKLGVVPSILPLQSFPMLLSSAPELQSDLHRIFPEHFPSAENANKAQASHPSPISSAGGSPARSPISAPSPARQSPVRQSPVRQSPVHQSPVYQSPVRGSPIGAGSPVTSPLRSQSPTHSDASMGGAGPSTDTNSLGALSFLPDNQQTVDSPGEMTAPDDDLRATVPAATISPKPYAVDIPESIMALGGDDIKHFQQTMPEPCTRPTESFLECLNDILISWIRQDNAVEIAAPLGSFLYASLERIIVSSRVGLSDSPKATSAGVFDSMLDQVLSESSELFVPFLKAMYSRDVTISYRLLAFCCSRSNSKSPDVALGPYAAFVEAINGNLAQNILKDLTLSQQIDDARAQACAMLGKQVPATVSNDEVDAVSATTLFVSPYLFANMEHPFLSKLMGRSEALVQLLLGLVTPAMLNALCTRVVMREFAIFKNRLANIVLSSLQWTSWEQYGMWDLVVAELQSRRSAAAEKNMMAAARKVLACVNPKESSETMTGLLKCLIHFSPDDSVLQSVFKLPDTYDDFPFAVLACWMDKFPDVVTIQVRSSLENASDLSKDKALAELVRKLDHLQEIRSRSVSSSGAEASKTSGQIAVLKDEGILAALKKLLHRPADASAATNYHSLRALLFDEEPPHKKPRLAGDN